MKTNGGEETLKPPIETEWNREIELEKIAAERQIQKDIIEHDKQEGFLEKTKQDILQEYNVIKYDKEGKRPPRVNCPRLAKILLNEHNYNFITMKDTQEVFYWNNGIYHTKGEIEISRQVEYYMEDLYTKNRKNEVIDYIKSVTPKDRDIFSENPRYINMINGVYDIKTKKLIDQQPNDFFLSQLPVNYDPAAECPNWLKFIKDVSYQEDMDFIQEMCGYLLYKRYTWAILVILLGHGRNGKTTFINVLSQVLGGDNVEHIPLYTLATDTFAKARLYKKHANLCADFGTKQIKDTEILKQLTGTDNIFARTLYQEGFNFKNYAKLMFACNTLPEIKDTTLAMTERTAIIEFPNEFKRGSEEHDPDIYDKLTTDEEISGILNWMLKGLKRLLKNKDFSTYRDFENVKEYQKQSQDPIYLFIDTHLEPEINSVITKQELYKEYRKFCEDQRFLSVNDVWFSRKLKQFIPASWEIDAGQSGKTTWKGVKLKEKESIQKIL